MTVETRPLMRRVVLRQKRQDVCEALPPQLPRPRLRRGRRPRSAGVRPVLLRVCGRTISVMAAIVLLAALVVGGGIWRLKQGPLAFDMLGERVAEALEAQFGSGFDVAVQHAQVEWIDGAPALAITGITIRDASGTLVVAAPQADIGFDLASLAVGSIVPRKIAFIGLAVALTIAQDGSVSISASGSDTDPAVQPVQPTDTSFGPGAVIDALTAPSGAMRVLQHAGIRDGRLRINDLRRGHSLLYEGLTLAYAGADDTGNRLEMGATGPSGPWKIAATVSGRQGGERRITLKALELVLSDLIDIAEPGTVPISTDMPVSGELTLVVGPDNAITDVQGRITGGEAMVLLADPDAEPIFVDSVAGEFGWDNRDHAVLIRRLGFVAGDTRAEVSGKITPPAAGSEHWQVALSSNKITVAGEGRDPPVVFDSMVMAGRMPLGLGGVIIDRLDFSGPEAGVSIVGSVGKVPDFDGLALDARTTKRMALRQVLALWPSFVVDDVRAYCIEASKGGFVESFSYRARLTPAMLAEAVQRKPVPEDAILVEGAVTGGAARFSPGLPLVGDMDGTLRVTGRTVAIQLRRGVVEPAQGQKPVVLSNGRFNVHDTAQHPSIAHITADAVGPVDSALDIARSDELRPFAPIKTEMSGVKGQLESHLSVVMPLKPNPTPKEVTVLMQGNASGVAVEGIFGRDRLEGANFAIVQDKAGLSLKGEGRIGGTQAQIALSQPAGGVGEVTVTTVLDDAARAKRGIKLASVAGPIDARLTVRDLSAARPLPKVELDLTRAALTDLLPGWTKPAGKPAKASFRLDAGEDGSATLDDFSLEGPGALAKGQIKIASDGALQSARLTALKLAAGDDMKVDYDRLAGGGSKIAVRANAIDARPIIRALTSPGASPVAQAGDVELDLKAGALNGMNNETIAGLDARLAVRGGVVREYRMSGRLGQAPLSGQLARGEDGAMGLVIESGNAGDFLRFFDIYRRMRGGGMLLQLDGNAPVMSGVMVVNGFILDNEPALARTAGQAEGNPNSVSFTKLRAGFSVGQGRIAIRDATMWGEAVGGTLEGAMDFNRDRIDMTGTFVPAYGLNNMFNKVPIVGTILGGGQNEGIFAVNFRLSGKVSQPTLAINPLSAVAPGILRKFFGVLGPDGTFSGAEPQKPGPADDTGRPLQIRP